MTAEEGRQPGETLTQDLGVVGEPDAHGAFDRDPHPQHIFIHAGERVVVAVRVVAIVARKEDDQALGRSS